MPNLKNNLSQKQNVILGVIIVVVALLLLSFNYINKKINMAYDYMNIQLLENEQPQLSNGNEESSNDNSNSQEETGNVAGSTNTSKPNAPTSKPNSSTQYIGMLEIPKISFKRGFTKKESSLNNVNKNITVLSASDYPDKKNGNFIIAAHSGNSSIAFFANLYKLENGDTASVAYKGKRYTYQIVNIYLEPKVGKVAIRRDRNKDTLTLITCTKDDDKHQTIYIAEKIKEENI